MRFYICSSEVEDMCLLLFTSSTTPNLSTLNMNELSRNLSLSICCGVAILSMTNYNLKRWLTSKFIPNLTIKRSTYLATQDACSSLKRSLPSFLDLYNSSIPQPFYFSRPIGENLGIGLLKLYTNTRIEILTKKMFAYDELL